MKSNSLHGSINTIILVAVLVANAFYGSELGGSGSVFNTISMFLVTIYVFLNPRLSPFLAFVFVIPIIFLFLSILVNSPLLTVGSYNSALSTAAGFVLLMLKPQRLNVAIM